jgi:hypothetical protein
VGPIKQVILLVLFNVCFVLPLLVILATLELAGPRAERVLARARAKLEAHWPTVLAAVALIAGAFVIAVGVTGLAGLGHGRTGSLARHIHHRLIHP